ncbi:hypothetical protein M0802_011856 [Mischocyttarus mexicanus]|nr:hypothetical protein M0802_011856 [Mischocyttarus mexicanus]
MIAIILLILFGTLTTINTNSTSFENSSSCQCLVTSVDDIKMDYDDNNGIEIIVDALSWDGFEVICKENKKLENFNYSSRLPEKKINSLSIRYCVLSDITSLEKFVKKLGIVESNSFSFQSFNTNNTLLTREHMKGISNVRRLILSHNGLFNISSEIFVDFPELAILDLSHNNLTILYDIFDPIPKLKYLDLSKSNIYLMSFSLFYKLNNLEYLDLGNNSLESMPASIFDQQESLKSLSLKANQMDYLPSVLFRELKKLEVIDISYNNFVSIPEQLFDENKNLRRVLIHHNTINLVTLPDFLFSNLERLVEINLKKNGFLYLPENLFWNSQSLKYISLANNNITYLKQNIFQGLIYLEVLTINNNLIHQIPDRIFIDLEKLNTLDLSMNIIDSIPRDAFEGMISLTVLNMENNRLKSIEKDTVVPLQKLIIAKFSNNQLNFVNASNVWSPFMNNKLLKELHLSNNSIENFFMDWSISYNLRLLNLSHNNISTLSTKFDFKSNQIVVDLSNNKISNITLNGIKNLAINQTGKRDVKVLINHNPILCDCHLYDLIRYVNYEMPKFVYNYVQIVADNLMCIYTNGTKGPKIEKLNATTFTCTEDEHFKIENKCQINCTCSVRPTDKTRILDCSNKTMSDFIIDEKRVYIVENYSLILNLTGNALTRIPSLEPLKSINLTDLLLSNNRISEITIDELPENLKVLELHNNSISRIDSKVIKYFIRSSLNKLTLSGNPIICDCNFKDLLLFVKLNRYFYEDLNNLKCEHMDVPMYNMSFRNFCAPVLGPKDEMVLNEEEAIV